MNEDMKLTSSGSERQCGVAVRKKIRDIVEPTQRFDEDDDAKVA